MDAARLPVFIAPPTSQSQMSIWENLVYSGRKNLADTLVLRQLFFINIFAILGFFSTGVFGLVHIIGGNTTLGTPEALAGVVFLLIILLLRVSTNVVLFRTILLITQAVLPLVMLATGGTAHTGIFWYFTFPISAFFLTGKTGGTVWTIGLYIATLLYFVFASVDAVPIVYSFDEVTQILIYLLIVCVLVCFYQSPFDTAEAHLTQMGQELQDYIDNMSGFNAKLAVDGTIILANSALIHVMGVSKEQLPNINFFEGSWWTFDEKVRIDVAQAFTHARDGQTVAQDIKFKTIEGAVIDINFNLIPVYDRAGTIAYLLVEARDISVQKKAEEDLKKRTHELERFNKFMIGREMKMIEMKKEITAYKKQEGT